MPQLIKKSYYCGNMYKCSYATRHHIWHSINTEKCPECKSQLVKAKNEINYPLAMLFLFPTMLITYFSKNMLFPTMIHGVHYVSEFSKVKENTSIVEIGVRLNFTPTDIMEIHYKTFAGTAMPGEDYTDRESSLIFMPGEQEKNIVIPIINDRDTLEEHENFHITLVNVVGQPKHTIIIEEEGVNKDLIDKANNLVTTLSALSADITEQAKTILYIQEYFNTSNSPSTEIMEKYEQVQHKLINAREKYIVLMNDTVKLDPAILILAIDNKISALKRGGFSLQASSTEILRNQIQRFGDTKIAEPDTWINEFSQIPESAAPSEKYSVDDGSIVTM